MDGKWERYNYIGQSGLNRVRRKSLSLDRAGRPQFIEVAVFDCEDDAKKACKCVNEQSAVHKLVEAAREMLFRTNRARLFEEWSGLANAEDRLRDALDKFEEEPPCQK